MKTKTITRRALLSSAAAAAGAVVLAQPRLARAQAAESAPPAKIDLTFFGWSDQHVGTKGQADHLVAAIDAMNALPGTALPAGIAGKVPPPAFVFGCGDITEWPTHAAKERYDELMTRRLKFPFYDIMGNHDEGGKVPSKTIEKYLLQRHKSLCYTFESGGVRFIAAYSQFDASLNNPAQPITKEALAYIRGEIAKAPAGQPLIVAMHLCLDAITNPQEVAAALEGGRVVMVLGGHYHKASVRMLGKVPFVQLPSPEPKSPPEITFLRITERRKLALPYDYRRKAWIEDPRKVLDAPL